MVQNLLMQSWITMNDNHLSNILDIKNYRKSFIESFDTNDIEIKNKLIIIGNGPDKEFLIKKEYKIVVQINGKKKDLISINKEISEEELLEQINKNEKTLKLIKSKKIKKTIYIRNKLINLII